LNFSVWSTLRRWFDTVGRACLALWRSHLTKFERKKRNNKKSFGFYFISNINKEGVEILAFKSDKPNVKIFIIRWIHAENDRLTKHKTLLTPMLLVFKCHKKFMIGNNCIVRRALSTNNSFIHIFSIPQHKIYLQSQLSFKEHSNLHF